MQHIQKCNYNRLGYSKMAYEMQQAIHVFNLELKYNAVSMVRRARCMQDKCMDARMHSIRYANLNMP